MADYAVKRTPLLSFGQTLVAWTTLALTLCMVILFGGNSPAYWTLYGMMITVLFAVQATLTAFRGGHQKNHRLRMPALLFLAALAWGLLQTWTGLPSALAHPLWGLVPGADATVSATPVEGGHGVLRLATYAMIFWIAVQASMNAKRSWRLICAFAVFSTALALFGLYAFFSGSNPVLLAQARNSVSATFVNSNSYALYASFGLIANLGLYLDALKADGHVEGSRRSQLRGYLERFFSVAWVFLFGSVICLSALLLTASRAGVASGLIGTAVLLFLFRRGFNGSSIMWLLVAILLGAVLTVLAEDLVTQILGMEGGLRFIIYPEIFAHLGDRLILGHGFGAFHDTFRSHVPLEAAGGEWVRAHSSYLENLWEMGLPAALAFYGALTWVTVIIFRGAVKRRRNRLFPVVAFACIVAGALHSLVDFSLQMPATAAMFAFLLGVGWAHAWPRESVSETAAVPFLRHNEDVEEKTSTE